MTAEQIEHTMTAHLREAAATVERMAAEQQAIRAAFAALRLPDIRDYRLAVPVEI